MKGKIHEWRAARQHADKARPSNVNLGGGAEILIEEDGSVSLRLSHGGAPVSIDEALGRKLGSALCDLFGIPWPEHLVSTAHTLDRDALRACHSILLGIRQAIDAEKSREIASTFDRAIRHIESLHPDWKLTEPETPEPQSVPAEVAVTP